MTKKANDEFYNLALKVATGRDAPGDQADLNRLLSNDPELQAEYERFCEDIDTSREALILLKAIGAPPTQIPDHVIAYLRAEVKRTFPIKRKQAHWHLSQSLLAFGIMLLTVSVIGTVFFGGFEQKTTVAVYVPHQFLWKHWTSQVNGELQIKTLWYYLVWTALWTITAAVVIKLYDFITSKKD